MYQEYLNQISLVQLSSDELKDLLNNEEKLDQKIDEVLINLLSSQKEALLTENRSRAEHNIEKEPVIIELRSKLQELQEETKNCCTTVQEKLAAVKEKSGGVSQETALVLLQSAAAESEEESEALIKQFNDNEISVDAYLEGFLSVRKTMHLRKLKAERMQELLRHTAQQQRSGIPAGMGTGMYSNLPSSGFYPSSAGGGRVPYPIGPMMPMPPQRPY